MGVEIVVEAGLACGGRFDRLDRSWLLVHLLRHLALSGDNDFPLDAQGGLVSLRVVRVTLAGADFLFRVRLTGLLDLVRLLRDFGLGLRDVWDSPNWSHLDGFL